MMIVNMNFERFRFQNKVENHLGCSDLTKWTSYLHHFKEFEITHENIEELEICLHQDGIDNLYKGLYSISNGLFNIYNGYYSWSVVKFYYSIFYLIRSYFSANNIGFLKNKGIYTLSLNLGDKPIRRDIGNYRNEKLSGDHKTTISTHIKEFGSQDVLLSNNIGELTIYDWLMEIRNQVNYRERAFNEPQFKYFPTDFFKKDIMRENIDLYLKDNDLVYCFNADHAAVAAPIKVLQQVCKFYYENTSIRLSEERIDVIEKMLKPMNLHLLTGFKEILNPT